MMTSARTQEPSGAAVAETEAPHYELRLYIAGSLPNSLQAQQNLRSICEAHLPGRHTIEVIDFLESPRRALEDGVVVTPTLVKLVPAPQRMVVGTLADRAAVLHALDLPERDDQP
jgi:circadian clock protein KaiB